MILPASPFRFYFFPPWAALLVLGAAATAIRLLAIPPLLPDLDSVNFARALERFELASQAPHFPGYPVYVLLSRAVAALGAKAVSALAIPGAVLAGPAVVLIGLAVSRHAGPVPAWVAASLAAFSPLSVLAGGTPASDGAGVACLAIAVAAALLVHPGAPSFHAALAGASCGLALGVRPSYALAGAALVLVIPGGRRASWAGGFAAGAGAWLAALTAATGPRTLATIAGRYLTGHVTEWGGTVAVEPDLSWRLAQLAFDLGPAGLGLPAAGETSAPRLLIALFFVLTSLALGWGWIFGKLSPGARRLAGAALVVGLPYGAWAFLAQNLLKPRHALPLVVAAALWAAAGSWALLEGWAPGRRAWAGALGTLLAVSLLAVTWPLARDQRTTPSPAAQLLAHVTGTTAPSGAMFFTGEEARLFEHYAPFYRAARPLDGEQLKAEAGRLSRAGVDVYVTSSAPGAVALSSKLLPIARFHCSRLVRPHASELVLYRYAEGGLL